MYVLDLYCKDNMVPTLELSNDAGRKSFQIYAKIYLFINSFSKFRRTENTFDPVNVYDTYIAVLVDAENAIPGDILVRSSI